MKGFNFRKGFNVLSEGTTPSVDDTAPVVTTFVIPDTSDSLTIPITAFTATDNVAVTKYKITESATPPLAGALGWTTTAPTTYTFTTDGNKTLYAWAKDAVGNVSTSASAQMVITLPDATKPVVTTFTIPATSSSLVVPVSSFTASDNKAVTGFKLTESATAPNAGDAGWLASAPVSYTFTSEGVKTLYAWAKDAAGNVSESAAAITTATGVSANIGTTSILSLMSGTANAARAYPVTMTEDGLLTSISIYHTNGNGTEQAIGGVYADDGSNKPGALLATTAQTLITASTEWQTIDFVTPVFVEKDSQIWIGWNKATGTAQFYYEEGSVTRASQNIAFGALPDPYGAGTYQNYGYSIYCTYLK